MQSPRRMLGMLPCCLIATALWLACTQLAFAHCDTLDGPVAMAARAALAKSDVTPVLMWVKPEHEAAIRAAFDKTLAVRQKGEEARELADMYFLETLVRLHRAGEGAPYTGLKPAGTPPEPGVAAADESLRTGAVDTLVRMVTEAVAAGIRGRFARALEAKKRADENVDAGREFVESYVLFVHYVERLHLDATGQSAAHAGEGQASAHDAHDH